MENNQRRVEEARNRVNAEQDQLQNSHHALMQVLNQQNELNTRRAAIEQVAQQIPVLQATADALNTQSAALLAGFTELREKATQLAVVMNDMRNGARTRVPNRGIRIGLLRASSDSARWHLLTVVFATRSRPSPLRSPVDTLVRYQAVLPTS